jgi:hypothetical protein
MKYFKHIVIEDGIKRTRYFQPEGTGMCIPHDPMNTDYSRMMEGVNADPPTNTIEEVDDTPE